jgi:ribonuclease R
MRSAAKLSYEQAQAAIDGVAPPDGQDADKAGPLLDPILKPLWAAFRLMGKGREARSPLAIESDERRSSSARARSSRSPAAPASRPTS